MIHCVISNKSTEDHLFKVFQDEDILFISEIDNNLTNYKDTDIIIIESVSKEKTLNLLSILQDVKSKIVILTGVPSIEEGMSFLKENKMIRAYANRLMSKVNMLQLHDAVSNSKFWFYPDFMKELKKRKAKTPSGKTWSFLFNNLLFAKNKKVL